MEEDYQEKHICKFCYKSFSSGRSLGGHMRSHMINVSSDDHQKHKGKHKLPKKKLPPLVNSNIDVKAGVFLTRKGNPKKAKTSYEADALFFQVKICEECGKSFQSGQALFGHMKCHSVNEKTEDEEDYWNTNSCNDNDGYAKQINDSQSDYEAATPSIKRKRSDRKKRYKANQYTTSSSVSEIDQQDQEEVALSLIMLSRESGKWFSVIDSVLESSNNSHELVEPKEIAVKPHKFKKINDRCLKPAVDFSNVEKIDDLNDSEVDSPRKVIKKSRFNQFESLPYVPQQSELNQDFDKKSKFECMVCRKVFPSYQALGGHRASHKKYKGCCAPTNSNSPGAEISPNPSSEESKLIKCNSSQSLTGGFTDSPINEVRSKRNKEHECPICFKAFSSGQALGGHKRSHLIGGQAKMGSSVVYDKPVKETRDFLDLNLPAPVEDEEFKPWWIESSRHKHESTLSFLSS